MKGKKRNKTGMDKVFCDNIERISVYHIEQAWPKYDPPTYFCGHWTFLCYEKFGQKLSIKESKWPNYFLIRKIVTLKSVISNSLAQDQK